MPTNYLSVGPVHSLVEDTIYAAPPSAAYIHSNVGLEVSNVVAFTTSQAISANTPTIVSGGFIRSTTAAAIVRLTRL